MQFLLSLNLKSVILMEQNIMDDTFADFLSENNINVIDPSMTSKEVVKSDLIPISDDIISEAMSALVNPVNLPTLIVCKTGKSYTSVLVACLRKLQKWSMVSVLEEFRRFAVGTKQQQQLEQLIELFDVEQQEITDQSPPFLTR